MDTTFIKNAIDAFKDFVGACANDVCNNESSEYIVFNGQISTDKDGNVKTYAIVNNTDANAVEPKKVLVAQVPLRPILKNLADFASSMVDLYEADDKERKAQAEAEAEAQAKADKAENEEIENKISDLQSEISSLKLRKKHVRYVKSF